MSVASGEGAAGATTADAATELTHEGNSAPAHEIHEVAESVFDVGQEDAFAEDSITPLELGDTDIVVIRQGGAFYALPDRCTHARFPLHDGELLDGKIQCAHHGATFDLETGRPTLPAIKKIQLFTAEVVDGRVRVTLQER